MPHVHQLKVFFSRCEFRRSQQKEEEENWFSIYPENVSFKNTCRKHRRKKKSGKLITVQLTVITNHTQHKPITERTAIWIWISIFQDYFQEKKKNKKQPNSFHIEFVMWSYFKNIPTTEEATTKLLEKLNAKLARENQQESCKSKNKWNL